MADTNVMDVDEKTLHNLCVWFLPGLRKGDGIMHLSQLDFKVVTTDKLKQIVVDEVKKLAEETQHSSSPKDIDLLYNGNLLRGGDNTLEFLKVNPDAMIHVVKSVNQEVSGSTASTHKPSPDHIKEIALALRTAFLSPTFLKTIEKLKDPEMLRSVFAIAPGLEADLTGIAIIQNPHIIFQLSEREALTRLAEKRPWVLEALNHIAATVHAEKGSKSSRVAGNAMLSQLLNTGFDAEDDDDMEDDEEAEPSRTQSQPNLHGPITREQLAQALNTVPVRGAVGGRAVPASPGGIFTNLFGSQATLPRPVTAPSTSNEGGGNPNFQQLLQTALSAIAQAGTQNSAVETPRAQAPLQSVLQNVPSSETSSPASGGPVLTGELVARAMQEAFSQLPPADRDRQFEMFRQLALDVARGNPSATGATASAVNTSDVNIPTREYQHQLSQMQELGITDERLSILALRVSGGDVETAAELIFSGWDGSGAELE